MEPYMRAVRGVGGRGPQSTQDKCAGQQYGVTTAKPTKKTTLMTGEKKPLSTAAHDSHKAQAAPSVVTRHVEAQTRAFRTESGDTSGNAALSADS